VEAGLKKHTHTYTKSTSLYKWICKFFQAVFIYGANMAVPVHAIRQMRLRVAMFIYKQKTKNLRSMKPKCDLVLPTFSFMDSKITWFLVQQHNKLLTSQNTCDLEKHHLNLPCLVAVQHQHGRRTCQKPTQRIVLVQPLLFPHLWSLSQSNPVWGHEEFWVRMAEPTVVEQTLQHNMCPIIKTWCAHANFFATNF
jgi:hypothetical protein